MSDSWPEHYEQDGPVREFPVNGQGILVYTKRIGPAFFVAVTSQKKPPPGERLKSYITLVVNEEGAKFWMFEKNKETLLAEVKNKESRNAGTESDFLLTYWFSYDRDACVLKYGKGFRMVETTLLTYDFLADCKTLKQVEDKRKNLSLFFSASEPRYVVVFTSPIKLMKKGLINVEPTFAFDPIPLVGDKPPIIKDSDEVTMFDIDRNQYTLSASLPDAVKEVYANIKNCKLDYPENPIMRLSDAIRFSIETDGKHLHEILKHKQGEFGKNTKNEVYIRITLGPNTNTAPGIPYVLEIWPKGCKSPIHNHGGACAAIKVLFGQIQISIFNKGTDPPREAEFIKKFDAKEGQFTWISRNWYQRHQLENTTNDYCATIQSYQYNNNDDIQWPGFDYISKNDHGYSLDTFWPTSDGTFSKIRAIVLKEYEEYLSSGTI